MKNSNVIIEKRRKQLIELIRQKKITSINELSQSFNVSSMTLRRDCQVLEEMGQVKITFGKIEAAEDLNFEEETNDPINHIKLKLAAEAALQIENHQTLFMNTSSTALLSLDFAKDRTFNLLTNNTRVVNKEHNPHTVIMLSGGEVRYPKGALTGDSAIEAFSNVRSDLSIIGCSGLDIATGISTSLIHEAKINSKIIEQSNKVVLVADYRKIGNPSNFTIGSIDQIDLLITDIYANPQTIQALEKSGIKVIQVPV
ncbi:DeoR/GlpR family DNA-binding transcription regulator [Streptococcus pacificus]|uniref:DeoR/GlpR transcriptional regulator n=1 Tax=Streptococcus pacificus TaxID=2740577 RepID=A0ABS0ZID4_9STRE|nr:DeoR/GlpR family DNA-binding transcription regulator [Streptococcus pacificus]MBJ8325775.1 DeoR/GlpR transcriptional regulator [Streptococcus pacificus]